jgi:hypothetical protein
MDLGQTFDLVEKFTGYTPPNSIAAPLCVTHTML